MRTIIGMCWAIIEDRIIRFTHRMWNRQISRIVCRAYNDRVINSEQLHTLLAVAKRLDRNSIGFDIRESQVLLTLRRAGE